MPTANKPEPRFRQIANSLKNLIFTGDLVEHAPIPSERVVAEDYEVGRMTARRALETLEAEGLIYSKNRLGRFVSPKRLTYNVSSMESFIDDATANGTPIDVEYLGCVYKEANPEVAKILNLPTGTLVAFSTRLFKRDGHSLLVESETIEAKLYEKYLQTEVNTSEDQVRFSVLGTTADITIKVCQTQQREAELLDVIPFQIGIKQEQIIRDDKLFPICITHQVWRGELVQFAATAVLKNSMANFG